MGALSDVIKTNQLYQHSGLELNIIDPTINNESMKNLLSAMATSNLPEGFKINAGSIAVAEGLKTQLKTLLEKNDRQWKIKHAVIEFGVFYRGWQTAEKSNELRKLDRDRIFDIGQKLFPFSEEKIDKTKIPNDKMKAYQAFTLRKEVFRQHLFDFFAENKPATNSNDVKPVDAMEIDDLSKFRNT